MLDMINIQKGIYLMNNNSIINIILFVVTIFQQGSGAVKGLLRREGAHFLWWHGYVGNERL
jgi:hypothetical protein